MDLITTLILLVIIASSIYYYLSTNYNFWQKQGIPCAKGTIPLLGNMSSVMFLQQNFNSLCEKYYKESGTNSMFGFYQLTTPTLLIRDPDLIKNILVTNFENFSDNQFQVCSEKKDSLLAANPFFSQANKLWKQSRAPFSNAFSGKKLKSMLGVILEVSSNMKDYLQKETHLQNGQIELELKRLFNRFTGDFSAASIGIKVDFFNDSKSESDVWNYKKMLSKIFDSPFFAGGVLQTIFINMPRLGTFFNISMTPDGVNAFLRNAVRKILAQRKLEEKNYCDFFQIISDYVMANPSAIDSETSIASSILTFTAEIYETSAIIMSFVTFQLALYPKIQENVRDEIKNVLAKYDGKLEYEGLKEMTYFEQVLNESMRINHIVGTLIKICNRETKLVGSDGLSCVIKPGQVAVVSAYGIQTDGEFWPDPEKFDPDRFSEERLNGKSKFTFLPFGEGPRVCVGKRISSMIVKVAVATILMDFSLQVSPKTPLPLKRSQERYLSGFQKGLWVILRPLK